MNWKTRMLSLTALPFSARCALNAEQRCAFPENVPEVLEKSNQLTMTLDDLGREIKKCVRFPKRWDEIELDTITRVHRVLAEMNSAINNLEIAGKEKGVADRVDSSLVAATSYMEALYEWLAARSLTLVPISTREDLQKAVAFHKMLICRSVDSCSNYEEHKTRYYPVDRFSSQSSTGEATPKVRLLPLLRRFWLDEGHTEVPKIFYEFMDRDMGESADLKILSSQVVEATRDESSTKMLKPLVNYIYKYHREATAALSRINDLRDLPPPGLDERAFPHWKEITPSKFMNARAQSLLQEARNFLSLQVRRQFPAPSPIDDFQKKCIWASYVAFGTWPGQRWNQSPCIKDIPDTFRDALRTMLAYATGHVDQLLKDPENYKHLLDLSLMARSTFPDDKKATESSASLASTVIERLGNGLKSKVKEEEKETDRIVAGYDMLLGFMRHLLPRPRMNSNIEAIKRRWVRILTPHEQLLKKLSSSSKLCETIFETLQSDLEHLKGNQFVDVEHDRIAQKVRAGKEEPNLMSSGNEEVIERKEFNTEKTKKAEGFDAEEHKKQIPEEETKDIPEETKDIPEEEIEEEADANLAQVPESGAPSSHNRWAGYAGVIGDLVRLAQHLKRQ